MQAVLMGVVILTGVSAVLLLGLAVVGGPMPLIDWRRKRRDEAVLRQILLTDALDAQLGPIVSPTVTKPLRGPWEVRMAVPVSQPAAVARALTIVGGVFAGQPYRVVLQTEDGWQAPGDPAERRWAADRLAAA
jgi:hypothetical protein